MSSVDGEAEWQPSKFYRVDLFQAGELTGIRFFESNELHSAKQCATVAVNTGTADRAEVVNDAGMTLFDALRRAN